MAKLSARGATILDTLEIGDFKWSLRSDGAVLMQWRYRRRLQKPTIVLGPTDQLEARRIAWQAWKVQLLNQAP